MYSSDARMVRGVSIAVIIFSSLALLGGVVVLFFLGIGGAALSDPTITNELAIINSDPELIREFGDTISGQEFAMLGSLAVGVGAAATIGFMLCAAVSLVAGIMGLRRASQPEKAGAAFGWAIAGAIAAVLSGRFITAILLVIAAVYLNRLKRATQYPMPAQAYPGAAYPAQATYSTQPTYPTQPVYPTQPAQPQPTPQQPAAPQQPTTPPDQQ